METPSHYDVSRRRFMKTALVGGLTAMASESLWHSAEAMLIGPQGRQVNGIGIEDPELVQLSINENPLGASPRAIEAVANKMFALNRYPAREPVLQEAIAKHHGGDLTWKNVVNGVGSTEVLNAIAMTAMLNGGGAVEPVPGYGAVAGVAEDIGRPFVRVPLTKDLQTDLNAVLKAINADTRIVAITNPNNPTGQLIPHDELLRFVDAVPKSVLICVDEAYIHFVEDENYPSMIPMVHTRPNLLVCRTMSKAFGLGGVRVGYGIGHPDLVDRMRPHYLGWLGRSILGDAAAIGALEDYDHLRNVRRHVIQEKKYLYQALTEMGLKPVKTQTIFVIVDMGRNTQPLVDELKARKVLIRQAFGVPNFIRISVGTHKENEVFIETMKEVMKKGV